MAFSAEDDSHDDVHKDYCYDRHPPVGHLKLEEGWNEIR
jgi:hypothetical protein